MIRYCAFDSKCTYNLLMAIKYLCCAVVWLLFFGLVNGFIWMAIRVLGGWSLKW
jgi:hypothetical protein